MNKKGTKKLSGALAATTVLTSVAGATPAFAKGTDWDAIYKTAYEAMVKAEKDRNQESIIVAREAIGKLLANKNLIHAAETFSVHVDTVQQELFNKFYKIIYVKAGVEKENISQKEVNEAREYVEQFGKCKENATYVSSWSTKIDEFQGKNIKAAQDAVEKAKKSGSDKDIEAAQNLVVELATSTNADTKKEAARLQKELDVLNTKVSVESVKAPKENELEVVLSREVDEVNAENFKIDGIKVINATLGKDKKVVTLKVEGAKLETKYILKVAGVKANKVELKETSKEFTMPSVNAFYDADVQIDKAEIKADGQSIAKVTFTLKDKEGKIVKDAKKVQVEFDTTAGRLSENKVTVQNGVATAILTSEVLKQNKTATVTATVKEAENKNFIGLKGSKNVLLNPNPDDGKQPNSAATLTEVQAGQADRVIAYFNKNVSVEKYCKEGTHVVDPKKAEITVKSDGVVKNVAGLLPVEGNANALQIVLQSGKELKDNANFEVKFKDLTGSKVIEETQKSKLTDARIPAMLNVEVPEYSASQHKDLKRLKITFSEPVQLGNGTNGATNIENWIIDGIKLSDKKAWGEGAKISVGHFYAESPVQVDERNVVYITLGTDVKTGVQKYFKGGEHSIQVANIGDRANVTDPGKNIMANQSMDFEIENDTTAPKATVEVQSPRQYIVRFNKEILDPNNNLDGILEIDGKKSPNYRVVRNGADPREYKVYISDLWTGTYNTNSTKQNYYNDDYKLVIGKGLAVGASNGIANPSEINLKLDGAMTSPDTKSPEIKKVEQISGVELAKQVPSITIDKDYKTKQYVLVNMSEPIAEEKDPSIEFIKKDNSKTVINNNRIYRNFYNQKIAVEMPAELTNGDWKVVVKDATDHVENKAASLTGDLKVTIAEDKFAVLWIDAHANSDEIHVKFNKALKTNGKSDNVLNVTNYQLDGKALPEGTQIKLDIKGVDDNDSVYDSITIKLPSGTLKTDAPHVLVVPKYLQSAEGEELSNPGSKTLPWSLNEGKEGYGNDQVLNQIKAEKLIYDAEESIRKAYEAESVNLSEVTRHIATMQSLRSELKATDRDGNKTTKLINAKKLLARVENSLDNIEFLQNREAALAKISTAKEAKDFAKAGINGVNDGNFEAVKNVIVNKTARKEIQEAVDTLNKSIAIINNKDLEDLVSPVVFEKAGIKKVTDANLKDVLAAIRAEQATSAKAMKAPVRNRLVLNAPQKLRTLTAKEIQKVVDDVVAEIKNKDEDTKNLAEAKKNLAKVIKDAEELTKDKYTSESWGKLAEAIKSAKKVDDKATLEEVNAQIKALTKAKAELNEKAQ